MIVKSNPKGGKCLKRKEFEKVHKHRNKHKTGKTNSDQETGIWEVHMESGVSAGVDVTFMMDFF